MAKKSKKRVKKSSGNKVLENILPQNILPVGEYVEENKIIYISQAVYKEIYKFTKNKTKDESGGMLVGSVIEEFGKTNILISGFVEAKYSEGTPTTLTFTHDTWDYVHKEIEKKYKGKKIVGWIHTHPNFGLFLSEYDKFIQENFFKEDYQVAYVVDPIQNLEGFYFWINERLERCKGFYVYDKTGVKINVGVDKEKPEETKRKNGFEWKSLLIAILFVAVVFLMISNVSTNNQLERLEKEQKILEEKSQLLDYMQQELWAQSNELQRLNKILQAAGFVQTEGSNEMTNEGGTVSE